MVATRRSAGPTAYSVDPKQEGGIEAVLKELLPGVLDVVVEVISTNEVHVTATAFKDEKPVIKASVKTGVPYTLPKTPVARGRALLGIMGRKGASIEAHLKLMQAPERYQALWGSFCITLPSQKTQRWDGELLNFQPLQATSAAPSSASSQSASSGGSQASLPRSTPSSSFVIGAHVEQPGSGSTPHCAGTKYNWGSKVEDLTKSAPAVPAPPETKGTSTTRTFKVTNKTHQSINLKAELLGEYPISGKTIPPGQTIQPGQSIPPGAPEGFKTPANVPLSMRATAGLSGAVASMPVASPGQDLKVVQGPHRLQLKAAGPPKTTWQDAISYVYDAATEDTRLYRDLPLTCSVFLKNSADGNFVFPELSQDGRFGIKELQAKKNFGVCVSGGGTRAAISSLGVVRGLHHMGVLAKARYLCSTSGGSWFNSAFSFNTLTLEAFLGPYIEPPGLTKDVLRTIGVKDANGRCSSFASTVQDRGNLLGLLKDLRAGLLGNRWLDADESGAWANWVTKSFLAPFGLGELEYSTVTARGTNGNVHEAIHGIAEYWANGLSSDTDRKEFKVYEYDSLEGQRPFPILMQTILLPKDTRVFYSKEWTPLYAGVLTDLRGDPARTGDEKNKQEQHLGGGYVESIGVNSKVDHFAHSTGSADRVNLRVLGPATLGGAAGISSSFIPFLSAFGRTLTGVALHLMLGGIFQWFWSPAHLKDEPFLTAMADGAGTDNPAITPLLRRKVKKIICWTHTDIDPTDENSFKSNSTVAQFFGVYPGRRYLEGLEDPTGLVSFLTDHPEPVNQNKLRQVFLKKDWDDLWHSVKKSYTEGGPVFHRAKLEVQENYFEAVVGGWTVEVLFVFNCTCKNFEGQLPVETKRDLLERQRWPWSKLQKWRQDLEQLEAVRREELDALPKALWSTALRIMHAPFSVIIGLVLLVLHVLDMLRKQVWHMFAAANLADFPLVPAQFLNYKPELVNMLSSQSAWATVQLKAEIDDMLAHADADA